LGDIIGDIVLAQSMQRNAGVPRGLLRFLVLKFLLEKPMSGAEIVEEIGRQTGGKWKPGPGSIYPLLAWLQNKGYTTSFTIENGMKRYFLTDKGKEFFGDQVKLGQNFLEKLEWLAPMLVGGFQLDSIDENIFCGRESAKKVLETFMELHAKQDSLTKQDVDDVAKILDTSNEQLKKILQRVKEKKPA
jgi:DNA-binding PadR family transcriptional regulator